MQPTCSKILCNELPIPHTVRIISKNDIKMAVDAFHITIGKVMFGKRLFTRLGPLEVCLKIFNKEGSSCHFSNEVNILCKCCHPNLPWLFGVSNGIIKISALSYISFHGSAINLFEGLYDTERKCCLTAISWKAILMGIANALVYLFICDILHNDIKSDNIMIKSMPDDACTGVLVDFGKGCMLKHGHRYHLSRSIQTEYLIKHPQIPPDVVKGEIHSHMQVMYMLLGEY